MAKLKIDLPLFAEEAGWLATNNKKGITQFFLQDNDDLVSEEGNSDGEIDPYSMKNYFYAPENPWEGISPLDMTLENGTIHSSTWRNRKNKRHKGSISILGEWS